MTRKDYVIIADAIASAIVQIKKAESKSINHITFEIIKSFQNKLWLDNENFDNERFVSYITSILDKQGIL